MATEVQEEKVTQIADRKEAIAAAVGLASEEDAKGATTNKDNEVKEEKKEAPAASDELSPEEAEQGRQLIRALKDPKTAPLVIEYLAKEGGYTKQLSEVETKKEASEAKKGLIELLKDKDGLGEEFGFLADKIGPTLEKYVAEKVAEGQADIRKNFEDAELERTRQQTENAVTSITKDFFGTEDLPDNVSKEMSAYMDRVSPSKNTTVKEYVSDAFHAAVGRLGLTKADKSKQQRSDKNRVDASSRLASERVTSEDAVVKNPKAMTRQEAIQAAIAELDKK